jgi:hypothetical protein
MPRLSLLFTVALGALLTSSCDSSPNVPAGPTLTRVTAESVTVPPNTPVTVTVELRESGDPVPGAPIRFYVGANTGVAETYNTDAQGRASFSTALTTAGTYTVTAQSGSSGPTQTFTIVVTHGPLFRIVFTPTALTLPAGSVAGYTLQTQDQAFNPVPNVTVQLSPTGGSVPASVTTDANGSVGVNWQLPTSTSPSALDLNATSGSVTGKTWVSLIAGPATSLTIAPTTQTVGANADAFFQAELRDQYGNRLVNQAPSCGSLAWSAPAPAVVTPQSGGRVRVNSPQSVTVTATCGSLSATAQLVIAP